MTLKFHWFLPTNGGDGRQVVGGGHGVSHGAGRTARVRALPRPDRPQRRAARLRGRADPDRRLVRGRLAVDRDAAPLSERLKFLVAFRPGLTSPSLAAQMAGTFQNLSGGRLLLNVVTGGESHEQRMYGDFLDKDGRYERCDEFLEIVRRLWAGEEVTFEGKHLQVEQARARSSSPTRCRRSTSAAPRRPRATSPPSTPTSTSPGASRRPPSPRRSRGSASSPSSRAARSASASGCTRSPATPPRRRGPRPTGCSPASTRRRSAGSRTASSARVRGPAAHARPQRRLEGRPRDPPQPLGRRRPGPRRRRHRAGRQPRGGRRPDRGVRRARHRRVRALRLPAPRGGLLVRRGRAARARPARPVDQPGPGRRHASVPFGGQRAAS